MLTLLRRWTKTSPRPDVRHLSLTIYTREQCGCCRKAIELVESRRRRLGFALELVDVDTDPALAERYGHTVPVVLVDGKVRFKGVVNPVLFDRLMAAESRGGRS